MRTSALKASLAAPVLLYTMARMIASAPAATGSIATTAAVAAGIAVSVLPVLSVRNAAGRYRPLLPWLGAMTVLLAGVAWAGAPWSVVVPGLAVGLLLGSPLLLLVWVFLWRESIVALVFNGTLALALGTLDLAIVRRVGGGHATVIAWWQSTVSVLGDQWVAIGRGSVERTTAPLAYLPDALFAAAAFALMMGLLISLLFSSERLVGVAAGRRSGPPSFPGDGPGETRLPGLASMSVPSSAYLTSGIASTVAALAAIIAFEWSASMPDAPTLGGLGLGAVGLLIVLAVFAAPARVATARRKTAPTSATPPPARFRGLDRRLGEAPPPLPYPEIAAMERRTG